MIVDIEAIKRHVKNLLKQDVLYYEILENLEEGNYLENHKGDLVVQTKPLNSVNYKKGITRSMMCFSL